MTSATERLRALLDERGVEWEAGDTTTTFGVCLATFWHDHDGYPCSAIGGTSDVPNGMVSAQATITPEQAIDATLGRGTCHDIAETPNYRNKTEFKCSECGYEYNATGGFGCDSGDEPYFDYCPNCGRKVEP